ncbi:hypothetical protein Tco_0959386 [Tanacetum coccineum]
MHMLTKQQVLYDDTHKQALGYQNLFYLNKAQRIKPTLYDGIVISKKHDVISVVDFEETLILADKSRSKMIAKQNDPISKEKKILYNLDAPALNEFIVINDLNAQLQAKESSISKLRAHIATLKGKNVSDNNEPVNNASVIAPEMFRLDLEPLSHKLKNNREAHEDYIQKTKEHTNTLRRIVEQARKLNPIDPNLDYALIQESSFPKSYVPPTKNDWDLLFQPMFDEYFNPPPSVVSLVPATAASRLVDSTSTPLSTSIEQDAPATAPFDDDPFLDILTSKPNSQESSSIVQPTNPPFDHISKQTKNHPLKNVIGNPSRPVSTRKQLQTNAMWCFFDAMWCFFDAILTPVEPKNFKEALLESS